MNFDRIDGVGGGKEGGGWGGLIVVRVAQIEPRHGLYIVVLDSGERHKSCTSSK